MKHLRGTVGGKDAVGGKVYSLVLPTATTSGTVLVDPATDANALKGQGGTDWFFGPAADAVDRVISTELLN